MAFEFSLRKLKWANRNTKSKGRQVLFLLLSVAIISSIIAGYYRAELLSGFARWWMVDDPVDKAEVIVVLGGGRGLRASHAARLYHAKIADRILIASNTLLMRTERGERRPEPEVAESWLLKLQVPVESIFRFGNDVSSTYEEAISLQLWLSGHPEVKTVIIPTDIFHTWRVKWLFEKNLNESKVSVRVVVVPDADYKLEDWWKVKAGRMAFKNELLKFIYYRVRY